MADDPEKEPSGRRMGSIDGGVAGGFALIGIGFELLAAVALFGAVGWWADRRMNWFPWLTIVGGAVGFAIGLTMIIRAAKKAFKD